LVLTFVENNILLPVNTMAYCARNFAYDSEEARKHNVKRMKSLDIKTQDEIENLYSAFLKTTMDGMHYFENFKKAKIQAEVMHELAHKDALTGLKNKTAYTEKTAKLDKDIAAGRAEFCIIMIDINFLKRVNDTYGHEYGNIYLINAGKLACSVFGEENVYRIGGDEFVVVLKDNQLSLVSENVAKFRGMVDKFKDNTKLEPWEKVSAAVGVAYYNEGTDKAAEEVFKRADADMYQNKLAMKATRKD
ncbi:MAG: GGDEF domain-containing protein, partial [Selenomonadaceae bacterium]|nr:GGDEF domain-containing protein [Selenomonadaceae bacterium]